jgi:uncharacterized Ntn-hydrolase superfamily protein
MRKLPICFAAVIAVALTGCGSTNTAPPQPLVPPARGAITAPPVATFSVVAFDPDTGELGVAVESKYFGVGTVVPWAKAKVGAIATQSYANVAYGADGLALLQAGKTAKEAVQQLTDADEGRALRQLGIVDARGNSASFTGAKCNPWAGHHEGKHFCVQGNLLTGEDVVEAMATAFEKARRADGSELADWLMASLAAGQAAGGDKRGQQSAALLVVREQGGVGGANDRYIDLRVEDHPDPIKELARLLDIHKKFYAKAHKDRPKPKPSKE